MNMRFAIIRLFLAVMIAFALSASHAAQPVLVLTNAGIIQIPDHQPAVPYPSSINVIGATGTVQKVTVTLDSFSHTYPADVGVLLVGPRGQSVVLMEGVGAGWYYGVGGAVFVFDDAATNYLPATGPLFDGIYKPTNYHLYDYYPPPAPGGPRASGLSVFSGLDPNGPWSLYIIDGANQDIGIVNRGWSLRLEGVAQQLCEPATSWYQRNSPTNRELFAITYGNGVYVLVGTNTGVLVSTNLSTWTNQFPAIGLQMNAVAYGNNAFIIAGQSIALSSSTNSGVWAGVVIPGQPPSYSDVAFGAGNFALTTTNGLIFGLTNRPGGLFGGGIRYSNTIPWRCLAFGGDRFVALGDGGAALVSTNGGTNWLLGSTGLPASFRRIAFAAGVFVAVGPGGAIGVSSNGFDWVAPNSRSIANFTGVAYGRGRFITMSDTSGHSEDRVCTSPDGFTWTPYGLGYDGLNNIIFANDSFIAPGKNGLVIQSLFTPSITTQPQSISNCVANPVALSVTAETPCITTFQWRRNGVDMLGATSLSLSLPVPRLEDSGSYSLVLNSQFASVTSAPAMVQISNCPALSRWQPRYAGSNGLALNAILCEGGPLFAIGDGGTVVYSLDESNWFAFSSGTNASLFGLAYGAGQFIAVGFSGVILSSSNAFNWAPRVAPTNRTLRAVAYGANTFVAVGDNATVLFSSDGATWSAVNIQTNRNLIGLNCVNNLFVATGNGGFLMTSPDGLTWTPRSSGSAATAYSTTWGAGQFLSVGNGIILSSSNAVNWTARASPVAAVLRAVQYVHGRFVAVGDQGTVISSADGIAWTAHDSATTLALNDLAYCSGNFFSVGANQIILETSFFGPPQLSGSRSGNNYVVGFRGEIGAAFRVQRTTNIEPAQWFDLASFTNFTPVRVFQDGGVSNAPHRFYRAISP